MAWPHETNQYTCGTYNTTVPYVTGGAYAYDTLLYLPHKQYDYYAVPHKKEPHKKLSLMFGENNKFGIGYTEVSVEHTLK